MLLRPEDILRGLAVKVVVQLWKSPGFSGVLWGGFLLVQLEFGAAFAVGCSLLPEAIAEERCQINVLAC